MDDRQLLRYSRHLLLPDIGIEGQQKLLAAHALVLGAGGLGSPVALFLASAGVGCVTIVDDDHVELTNLQRQIMHTQSRIGQPKVQSAQAAMQAINPDVRVNAIAQRADAHLLQTLLPTVDVALDCSDNFATRQLLNRQCVALRKPLVSGAAIGMDGQLAVFDARRADSPCYACAFPPSQAVPETRCATMGVLAPLVGVIGAWQAAEAIKLICNAATAPVGRLLMLDMRQLATTTVRLPRQPQCEVCGSGAPSHTHTAQASA